MIPYIKQGPNIVMILDGSAATVSPSHINFKRIKDDLEAGNFANIKSLYDIADSVKKATNGEIDLSSSATDVSVKVSGDTVKYAIAERIIKGLGMGEDMNKYKLFMANCHLNPSKLAIEELYQFLEKCDLPITDDGCFLAFKKVDSDFYDLHSHTVPHYTPDHLTKIAAGPELLEGSYGKRNEVRLSYVYESGVRHLQLSMPREDVDSNRSNTCSSGLHFCSKSYLPYFGLAESAKILILKINPKDVVSIPTDYDLSKGRASSYVIMSLLTENPETVFSVPGFDYYEEDDGYEY